MPTITNIIELIGHGISLGFSLICVVNFIICKNKNRGQSRFVFYTLLSLVFFHTASLWISQTWLPAISASLKLFCLLASTYGILLGVAFTSLLFSTLTEFVFDQAKQLHSQRIIEKAFFLTFSIALLIAFYPVFQNSNNNNNQNSPQNNQDNTYLPISIESLVFNAFIPAFLCLGTLIFLIRAKLKTLNHTKEMRLMLINESIMILPRIILVFFFFDISQRVYSYIASDNYDILQIPIAFVGLIAAIHYILFSGLFQCNLLDKAKILFTYRSYIEELSLVSDPHAETLSTITK